MVLTPQGQALIGPVPYNLFQVLRTTENGNTDYKEQAENQV